MNSLLRYGLTLGAFTFLSLPTLAQGKVNKSRPLAENEYHSVFSETVYMNTIYDAMLRGHSDFTVFTIDRNEKGACVPVTEHQKDPDILKEWRVGDEVYNGPTQKIKNISGYEAWINGLSDYLLVKAFCEKQPECQPQNQKHNTITKDMVLAR